MGITGLLLSLFSLAFISFIFGMVKKKKIVMIISSSVLGCVILYSFFLIFVLIPAM